MSKQVSKVTNKKISIQMAARELRYDWFRLLQDKYKFRFIATAHHYDDQIETLYMNYLKKTMTNLLTLYIKFELMSWYRMKHVPY